MKKIKAYLEIILYDYEELNEEAQFEAMQECINDMICIRPYDKEEPGNYEKAIDEAKKNNDQDFTDDYILKYCKDEVFEELRHSYFDKDGKFLMYKTADTVYVEEFLKVGEYYV